MAAPGRVHLGAAWAAVAVLTAAGPVVCAAADDAVAAPVPRAQPQPEPVTNRFGFPIEGWVRLRYTVLADGTTADVRAVEVMPPQLSERTAVDAVEAWTFEPARTDGAAVEWHNNESLIVFDNDNAPLEPTPMFLRGYLEVNELMEQQELEDARKRNRLLLNLNASRLNEIGLVQAQAAMIGIGLSDLHAAYDAIVDATDPVAVTLEAADLAQALGYRFALETELGRYRDALETFDRLSGLETAAADETIPAQARAIREALSSDAAIVVKGRVEREPWVYRPARRTFGFAEVDGGLRAIELECDRRKTELEYSADVEWSIPESWGQCTVFVDARRDTTFSLVEFP